MTEPEFALAEYDTEQADEMLDALVEADGEEFAERRRGRGRRGRAPSRTPAPAAEMQRNGQGIKAINDRINALEGKVNQAVGVIARDRSAITRLEKLGKIDGALDLAQSFDLANGRVDVFQVLRGSYKSGFFGTPKGALGNPALIGVAGLLLQNPQILKGALGGTT
ncbi:hypothetical protein ACGFK1_27770 [Mycobacterium sp. NPDC048908]|uniref:hypothetical protein n=1 Tax=Mycobacterium sp. NPDC048908 TaxID=3364292 RepID=UPI00371057FB